MQRLLAGSVLYRSMKSVTGTILALLLVSSSAPSQSTEVHVADFGAKGDGTTDDAAALGKAVAAVNTASKPAVLRFEAGRTYRVSSGFGYVIALLAQEHITVEGGGATLLLGGERRGVMLRDCRDVSVRGLRVDYDPLPFAEALVTGVDKADRSIEVQIADGFAIPPPGGPTRSGGEQAYFAMLWNPGPYALRGTHYWLANLSAVPGQSRQLYAAADNEFNDFNAIRPGVTRISLPVRGIAHRYGTGAVIQLDGNLNVLIEDVEVWSAPWMACGVQGNQGTVTFRRVQVRPKPGTARLTSSWRDGIHVKGNRARLLFEDCVLDGMNDDAFNIATFLSRVDSVDRTLLQVHQNYPLGYVAWRVGDTLAGYAAPSGTLLGRAKVVAAAERPNAQPDQAPQVTLTLDHPLPGLAKGDQVWAVEAANPDTTLRRCTMRNSCRFQSPVTLEDCDVTAFLWFYGEHIEGPLPSGSVVRHCRLRLGRGNLELAVSCDGWLHGLPPPATSTNTPPLIGLRFEDNDIDGRMEIQHAQQVRLLNNHFAVERGRLTIRDCRDVQLEGNKIGNVALPAARIQIEGKQTRDSTTLR